MHILLLTTRFLPGSKEATKITVTEYQKLLEEQGHQVVLVDEKSLFKTVKRVKQFQQQENTPFDVIHGFSAAPLMAMKVLLVKLLCSPQAKTVQTLKSYSRNFLGSLYFSWLLNFVDTVTIPTYVFKEKLIRNGCLSKRFHVIRSPVNTKKFIHLNKDTLKKKYGYENKKIIFYYGSLHPNKGLDYLLHAFPEVRKNNPDAFLLIAPRHQPDQQIREQVNALGENVKIITDEINIVEYLNMADVLVLPYKNLLGTEGNPSCLLEAMACKVPVITSDLLELREIVTPEEDVLMVPPGNVNELSRQMNRVLQDKRLQATLTEKAYQKSRAFDRKLITQQFLGLYQKDI